ncbi:MAG: excinuclease ABC subunit UvrA, partial [Clostridia bacterium]
PRSIVGTVTEIYDYMRLLYARIGTPHCYKCGKEISKQTVDQICDKVATNTVGAKIIVKAPVVRGRKGEYNKLFETFKRSGYVRVEVDGNTYSLEENIDLNRNNKHSISVIIDRLILHDDISARLAEAIEAAMKLADDLVIIQADGIETLYSGKYTCPDCGVSIDELEPRIFSFNSPFGACPKCTGLGFKMEFDIERLLPDKTKSISDGLISIIGFNMDGGKMMEMYMTALSKKYGFSLNTPFIELPQSIQDLIIYGNNGEKMPMSYESNHFQANYNNSWEGLLPMLNRRYKDSSSDFIKREYESNMIVTFCPECNGQRLKPQSLAVTVGGFNIYELCNFPINKLSSFFNALQLDETKTKIAYMVLKEIKARLQFLIDVGLSYLTLWRNSSTLSGGEAQRIRLATQIGSGLMGVLYILDEPSIGLHQRDNAQLIKTLEHLRDIGNTLIVVEHDEDTIRSADHIIDIGPGAGVHGGYLVAQGSIEDIMKEPRSITGQYLSGAKHIMMPKSLRKFDNNRILKIIGASQNNLKCINVDIPLGLFTVITGVSGSGKSSLVNDIIRPFLSWKLNYAKRQDVSCEDIIGYEQLDKIITIDQAPIGRTPRSNPATYTNVFTAIRDLFASTIEAKERGYKVGRFSFNIKGGRCENCGGDGIIKIEMNFLPDVYVLCEVCHGKRYNRETLQVKYKGKNIADVLDMTVEEALDFFQNVPSIQSKIQTLFDVGLGYIKLGQSATTLSGGEAQRVKLATELSKRSTGKTIYVLDEPTTGLHAADVDKLLQILQRLASNGNTVLVIEHNLDVIKVADYVIDLGPEGGDKGGEIIATGTPEQIALCKKSYTGMFLKKVLDKEKEYNQTIL